MSRLFRSRHSAPPKLVQDHHSAYLSLLEPSASARQPSRRSGDRRPAATDFPSRPWLAAAENGLSSWTGERPPARKLVKDMNGSGRPSFSVELSDSDGEKEKGLVRRQLTRLKELYRREK